MHYAMNAPDDVRHDAEDLRTRRHPGGQEEGEAVAARTSARDVEHNIEDHNEVADASVGYLHAYPCVQGACECRDHACAAYGDV